MTASSSSPDELPACKRLFETLETLLISGAHVNGQMSRDARKRARLTEHVVVFSIERWNPRDKRC